MKTRKIKLQFSGTVSLDNPIRDIKSGIFLDLKKGLKTDKTLVKVDFDSILAGFHNDDFVKYQKSFRANVTIHIKRCNKSR